MKTIINTHKGFNSFRLYFRLSNKKMSVFAINSSKVHRITSTTSSTLRFLPVVAFKIRSLKSTLKWSSSSKKLICYFSKKTPLFSILNLCLPKSFIFLSQFRVLLVKGNKTTLLRFIQPNLKFGNLRKIQTVFKSLKSGSANIL